jgi:PAP2 superfamily
MHTNLFPATEVRSEGRRLMRLPGELVLMGGLFLAYRQTRHLAQGDTEVAMANASRVVDVERQLHVFSEAAVQRLVLHSRLIIDLLNHYYVMVHFPVTIAFLLWAHLRHPGAYSRIRVWFIGVTSAALAIHVAYPLAPPRMLRGNGFVDTLHVYGPRIYSTDTTESVANQFAAMPSLHFGWALLLAVGFAGIKRTKWSLLAFVHPAVTLLAIVATANHYWLDAAVAFLLIVVVGATIHYVPALRRRRTSHRTGSHRPGSHRPGSHRIAGDLGGLDGRPHRITRPQSEGHERRWGDLGDQDNLAVQRDAHAVGEPVDVGHHAPPRIAGAAVGMFEVQRDRLRTDRRERLTIGLIGRGHDGRTCGRGEHVTGECAGEQVDADKVGDVRGTRVGGHVCERPRLHHGSGLQHDHTIGEGVGVDRVVRHQQTHPVEAGEVATELTPHLSATAGIECGQRFVEQQ